MGSTLRTIVIEDSDIYRKVLSEIVERIESLELIGVANGFERGRDLLLKESPDLLLLDIEIGEVTSFELIPFISESTRVIFITSHPEYAVKAFEISAADYIVKPITEERLRSAVAKILQRNDISTSNAGSLTMDQKILVNKNDHLELILVSDISYISSLGNYVKIFSNSGQQFVKYGSIKSWITKLPQNQFMQIHRSTIINLNQVEKFEKWTNDTGRAYMKNAEEYLEISRSYFQKLKSDLDI